MKVNIGDILDGNDPATGKLQYYKYLGTVDKNDMLYKSGFKRRLKRKGDEGILIVSDDWCKSHKLRPHIKKEK